MEPMLRANAALLVQPGKGILAADENPSSLARRFQSIGVDNTAEQRRVYRQLLLTAPDIQRYISGVILHEETFNQSTDSSVRFPTMLAESGILPGVKLDRGLESLTVSTSETTTLGFDDLEMRCEEFFTRGARFAKWRCVFRINNEKNHPSELAIANNTSILARFASICQAKGLVPLIEPEVIADGDHDLRTCQCATENVLAATFKALSDYDVLLEGCVLKPNMVTPGREAKQKALPAEIALATITALNRTCPVALAGIAFLSGGQSEGDATRNLNEMNKPLYQRKRPWKLTFSYGRALQASALKSWNGKRENESNAQASFLQRAAANAAACQGQYGGRNASREARETLPLTGHDN